MAQLVYTIELSRWTVLRLMPSAWFDACRAAGVSPWRPGALLILVTEMAFVALFGWRERP